MKAIWRSPRGATHSLISLTSLSECVWEEVQREKKEKKVGERASLLLLLSNLGTLRGAGVVPDLLSEADRHGCVTIVNGDHSHFFSGRSKRVPHAHHFRLKHKIKHRSRSFIGI